MEQEEEGWGPKLPPKQRRSRPPKENKPRNAEKENPNDMTVAAATTTTTATRRTTPRFATRKTPKVVDSFHNGESVPQCDARPSSPFEKDNTDDLAWAVGSNPFLYPVRQHFPPLDDKALPGFSSRCATTTTRRRTNQTATVSSTTTNVETPPPPFHASQANHTPTSSSSRHHGGGHPLPQDSHHSSSSSSSSSVSLRATRFVSSSPHSQQMPMHPWSMESSTSSSSAAAAADSSFSSSSSSSAGNLSIGTRAALTQHLRQLAKFGMDGDANQPPPQWHTIQDVEWERLLEEEEEEEEDGETNSDDNYEEQQQQGKTSDDVCRNDDKENREPLPAPPTESTEISFASHASRSVDHYWSSSRVWDLQTPDGSTVGTGIAARESVTTRHQLSWDQPDDESALTDNDEEGGMAQVYQRVMALALASDDQGEDCSTVAPPPPSGRPRSLALTSFLLNASAISSSSSSSFCAEPKPAATATSELEIVPDFLSSGLQTTNVQEGNLLGECDNNEKEAAAVPPSFANMSIISGDGDASVAAHVLPHDALSCPDYDPSTITPPRTTHNRRLWVLDLSPIGSSTSLARPTPPPPPPPPEPVLSHTDQSLPSRRSVVHDSRLVMADPSFDAVEISFAPPSPPPKPSPPPTISLDPETQTEQQQQQNSGVRVRQSPRTTLTVAAASSPSSSSSSSSLRSFFSDWYTTTTTWEEGYHSCPAPSSKRKNYPLLSPWTLSSSSSSSSCGAFSFWEADPPPPKTRTKMPTTKPTARNPQPKKKPIVFRYWT